VGTGVARSGIDGKIKPVDADHVARMLFLGAIGRRPVVTDAVPRLIRNRPLADMMTFHATCSRRPSAVPKPLYEEPIT